MFLKKYDNLDISKNTPFVIYGAAGNGMRGYHSLKALNNYNVVGFIDRRADEIKTQYGLPVWNINELPECIKEECVICICIKNVFAHESIADELIKLGYHYLIFKPINSFKEYEIDYPSVNKNYDMIFNEVNPSSLYSLESLPYLTFVSTYEFKDQALIYEDGSFCVANLPIVNIFANISDWKNGLMNCDGITSATMLFPQISLFNWLLLSEGNTNEYLTHCANTIQNSEKRYGEGTGTIVDTPSWRESIIEGRIDSYNRMRESMELNNSFFKNHAPECVLDYEDRLIIKSAKHRLAYFISNRNRYIPVKVSKDHYSTIINDKAVNEVKNVLMQKGIKSTNVPIPHPMFYSYPSNMTGYYESFVYSFLFWFSMGTRGHEITNNITILDCFSDDGMIARILSRIGFNSYYCLKSSDEELCSRIDDLLFSKAVISTEIIDCDLMFVMQEDIDSVKIAKPSCFVVACDQDCFIDLQNYSFVSNLSSVRSQNKIWSFKVFERI